MDKVRGGTPKTTASLCMSCRNCHAIRGVNFEERIFCYRMSPPTNEVHFPVVECTQFDDKRVPSLYDMEQIAWHVKSRNRGQVGFVGKEDAEVTVEPPSDKSFPENLPKVAR